MNRTQRIKIRIAILSIIGFIIISAQISSSTIVRGFSTDFQTISMPAPTVTTQSLTYYSTQNLARITDNSNSSWGTVVAVNTHGSGSIPVYDKIALEYTILLPAGRLANGNLILRVYDYYSEYLQEAKNFRFGNNYSSIISYAPALGDWPFDYHYHAQFTINVLNAQSGAAVKSIGLTKDLSAQMSAYLSEFTLNDSSVMKQIVTQNLPSVKYRYMDLIVPLSLSSDVPSLKISLIASNDGKSNQQYFGDAQARPGSAYIELGLAEMILRLNSVPMVKITTTREQTMVVGESKSFPFNIYVDQYTSWYRGGTAQIKVDSAIKTSSSFTTVKDTANILYQISAADSKLMAPGIHHVSCSILSPVCSASDYYTVTMHNDVPRITLDNIPVVELGNNFTVGYQISDNYYEVDRSLHAFYGTSELHHNTWNPNTYVQFTVNSTFMGVGTHNISLLIADGYSGTYTPGIVQKNVSITIVDTTKPQITLLFDPTQAISNDPQIKIEIFDFNGVTARFSLHDQSPATNFEFHQISSLGYKLDDSFSNYWLSLIDGYYAWSIEAVDDSGNVAQIDDFCVKDTYPPMIFPLSFENGEFWNDSKEILIYIDDVNPISLCNLTIGSTKFSLSEYANGYFIIGSTDFKEVFLAQQDGPVLFSFNCCDAAANQYTEAFTIIKDTTAPIFSIDVNDYYSSAIGIKDVNSSEMVVFEFSIDGESFKPMGESIPLDILSDGLHRLRILAKDRACNQATKEFEFTKDSILPSILTIDYPREVYEVAFLINITASEISRVQILLNSNIIATSTLSAYQSIELNASDVEYGLNLINITILDRAGNIYSRMIEIERIQFGEFDLSTLLPASPLQAILGLGLVGLASGITYAKTRSKGVRK